MFYIIVFFAIILPLVLKEKEFALKLSMFLIFILWGLNYGMTQDDYETSWNYFNLYTNVTETSFGRDVEPLFVMIVKATKPFGFFGFKILCAIFDISVFYLFIKRFVPRQYYWLTIFIFLIRIEFGLLFINSIRQSLSLALTMIGVYILISEDEKKEGIIGNLFKSKLARIIFVVACILTARLIHKGAIAALLILPIYFLSIWIKTIPQKTLIATLIVCNVIFLTKYYIDITILQNYLTIYIDFNNYEGFEHYVEELAVGLDGFSKVEETLKLLMMNGFIISINKLNKQERFFAFSAIAYFILAGFLSSTLSRVLEYIYVYIIFVAPIMFRNFNMIKGSTIATLRPCIYLLMATISLYTFKGNLNHTYYERWNNFETTLSQPFWK